jgi:hypothetical protein
MCFRLREVAAGYAADFGETALRRWLSVQVIDWH